MLRFLTLSQQCFRKFKPSGLLRFVNSSGWLRRVNCSGFLLCLNSSELRSSKCPGLLLLILLGCYFVSAFLGCYTVNSSGMLHLVDC